MKKVTPQPILGHNLSGSVLDLCREYSVALNQLADHGFSEFVTVTGSYTAGENDHVIECSPSGAMTVTLPAASVMRNKRIVVKRANNTTHVITIQSTRGNIDTSTSVTLTTAFQSCEVFSDGENWWLLDNTATLLTDPYWSYVVLLLHNDALAAAGELIDSSSLANDTYITTGVSLSTIDSKFGGSSLYFDGVSSAGGCRAFASLTFGTTDFCVETFINANGTQPNSYADIWKSYAPVSGSNFKTGSISLDFKNPGNNDIRVFCYNYSTSVPLLSSATNLAGAGWKHVAVTRSGSTFRLFVDGVIVDTETFAGSVSASAQDQFIGSDPVIGASQMKGYLDDFRITFGVPRYTANFTPATAAFPNL
jgi:hypothetical protein